MNGKEILKTNALAHEFLRCEEAFLYYAKSHLLLLNGTADQKVSIHCYNAYSDFVSHLYEFYLGCIQQDSRFPSKVSGKVVDAILNAEVEKLLNIRRERIARGDAPAYENDISSYEMEVPEEFGSLFRAVRNIRSHATHKRSEFDLAEFYLKYHAFVFLLFEEAKWLWDVEQIPDHDWLAITKFANAIITKRPAP